MYSSLFVLTVDGILAIIKVKKGITPANGYLPQNFADLTATDWSPEVNPFC